MNGLAYRAHNRYSIGRVQLSNMLDTSRSVRVDICAGRQPA